MTTTRKNPTLSSINSDYQQTTDDDDVPLITAEEEKPGSGFGSIVFREDDDVPPIYSEKDTRKPTLSGENGNLAPSKTTTAFLPGEDKMIPNLTSSPPASPERFRITIEPIVLSAMLGTAFQSVTNHTLLLFTVCHVAYNHSEAECRNYSSPAATEDQVQAMAADITLYKSFLETLPGFVICFFVGPWSDRHGRKLPIFFPLCGFVLSATAYLIAAIYTQTPPLFLLLPSALLGMSGGLACFLLGIFSFVTDVSSAKTRTLRIAIVDLSMGVGLAVGIAVSGAIYSRWGYVPSYGVSMFLQLFAVVYLVFFTKESLKRPSHPGEKAWQSLFQLSNIAETIRTCLRRREGNQRAYILSLVASLCVMLLPFVGETAVSTLYFSKKFHWDQTDQSYFTSYTIVISIIGVAILFRFVVKRFKVPDLIVGLVGLVGFEIKSMFMAFSQQPWQLYLGSTVAFFQPLALPIVRSVLTKIITSEEQGKLFAFMTSCETAIPLFANTVYTQVYKLTEHRFPGAVYLFTAGAMIIPLVAFSWIYLDMKKRGLSFNVAVADNQETAEDASQSPLPPPHLEPVAV